MEYGLGIELAPQANQFPQIRLGGRGWESLRFNADGKCSSLQNNWLMMFSGLMAMFMAHRLLLGAMLSAGRRQLFAGRTDARPMAIG
jgi:hypothetical protein